MKSASKTSIRTDAKLARKAVMGRVEKSIELVDAFPLTTFRRACFAGFWPLGDEIDMRPLMTALVEQGERVCLPLTGPAGTALTFKDWTPLTDMVEGRYGTREPKGHRTAHPSFIFVPLLAFDTTGGRIGYGGGYYDRTVAALRGAGHEICLLYTSPSPRDQRGSRMPSSA